MKARSELCESPEEELANLITHGIGVVISVVATVTMLRFAIPLDWGHVVGVVVFGISLILLYSASTAYHTVTRDPAKKRLQLVDHTLIYVLIAGSYTPWLLVNLRGPWGWSLLALVWTLALLGVLIKLVWFPRFQRFGLALYIVMGWIVCIAIKPMFAAVNGPGMLWLFIGGILYTVGVIFYAQQRLRFAHLIWHLFVLGGSISHIVAVFVGVLGVGEVNATQ